MTVKEGDIVFVTEAHHADHEAPAVVVGVSYPKATVHIFGTPHRSNIEVGPREYADDAGYREANTSKPTENRPKPVVVPEPEGIIGGDDEVAPEGIIGGDDSEEEEEEVSESEESESPAETPEEDDGGESEPPARSRRAKGRGR